MNFKVKSQEILKIARQYTSECRQPESRKESCLHPAEPIIDLGLTPVNDLMNLVEPKLDPESLEDFIVSSEFRLPKLNA